MLGKETEKLITKNALGWGGGEADTWAREGEERHMGRRERRLSPTNGCASQQIKSKIDFVVNVWKIEYFTLSIQISQFS